MKIPKTHLFASLAASCLMFAEPSLDAAPVQAPAKAANTAEALAAFRAELIRARMRDYAAKLESDHEFLLRVWTQMFVDARGAGITAASKRIVEAAERIRRARRIDATEVKSDPGFRAAFQAEIRGLLETEAMKRDLAKWAESVESQTRARMIECFQQIIAEDLGRSFDDKLRGKVVAAVKQIPVAELASASDGALRIEKAILGALPEAEISAASRKAIVEASVALAKTAAFTAALNASASHDVATAAATVAGEVARVGIEAEVWRLNEEKTAKSDPVVVGDALKRALADWSDTKLKAPLAEILDDFRGKVLEHVEEKARHESLIAPLN